MKRELLYTKEGYHVIADKLTDGEEDNLNYFLRNFDKYLAETKEGKA